MNAQRVLLDSDGVVTVAAAIDGGKWVTVMDDASGRFIDIYLTSKDVAEIIEALQEVA